MDKEEATFVIAPQRELIGIFISRSEHATHHAYKEYFSHIYFFDDYMDKESTVHDMFHRAQWNFYFKI